MVLEREGAAVTRRGRVLVWSFVYAHMVDGYGYRHDWDGSGVHNPRELDAHLRRDLGIMLARTDVDRMAWFSSARVGR